MSKNKRGEKVTPKQWCSLLDMQVYPLAKVKDLRIPTLKKHEDT